MTVSRCEAPPPVLLPILVTVSQSSAIVMVIVCVICEEMKFNLYEKVAFGPFGYELWIVRLICQEG